MQYHYHSRVRCWQVIATFLFRLTRVLRFRFTQFLMKNKTKPKKKPKLNLVPRVSYLLSSWERGWQKLCLLSLFGEQRVSREIRKMINFKCIQRRKIVSPKCS